MRSSFWVRIATRKPAERRRGFEGGAQGPAAPRLIRQKVSPPSIGDAIPQAPSATKRVTLTVHD
jgi:hypothetical protein